MQNLIFRQSSFLTIFYKFTTILNSIAFSFRLPRFTARMCRGERILKSGQYSAEICTKVCRTLVPGTVPGALCMQQTVATSCDLNEQQTVQIIINHDRPGHHNLAGSGRRK